MVLLKMSIFHALVCCPKAYVFCMALREVWKLPGEEILKCSGLGWFLILLDQLSLLCVSKQYYVLLKIIRHHSRLIMQTCR